MDVLRRWIANHGPRDGIRASKAGRPDPESGREKDEGLVERPGFVLHPQSVDTIPTNSGFFFFFLVGDLDILRTS